MKRKLSAALFLVTGFTYAQSTILEPLARRSVIDCGSEIKLTQEDLRLKLPPGFSGKQVKVESSAPGCSGMNAAIVTPSGNFFFGSPWPLSGIEGTPAERIRKFALTNFNQSFQPTIATERNADGLLPVTLTYTTEYGRVPMEGFVDPAGTIFFPGILYPTTGDFRRTRLERLAPVLTNSPGWGPVNAAVTVVEFSDFQCPSCKNAAAFVKPIVEKYGDQVRYTRIDYPLVTSHPWAFGASVIGRAIYKQSPEAFWKFKDAVYENQSALNLFTLEDFARGFVSDHDLNVETFNTDIASPAITAQILDSIAAAHALQVHGTPTFLVNGDLFYAGAEGKNLDAAIARALKK
jgi:protein-disulfide isomerase